jgi:hypothetical protein
MQSKDLFNRLVLGPWRQKPPSSCRLASDKARGIVALVHCLVLVVEKEETRPRSIAGTVFLAN